MARLLDSSLKLILQGQSSITARTNVPNDHPVMDPHRERLEMIAKSLGIDFEATGYTFTVDVREFEGKIERIVYSPFIGLKDGVPSLVWGNVAVPLKDLAQKPSYTEVDRAVAAEFVAVADPDNADDLTGEAEFIQISLSLAKNAEGKKPGIEEVKKAAVKGKLGDLLVAGFEKPRSLSELPAGQWWITGYSYDAKFDRFNLTITEDPGKSPVGTFKANKAIKDILLDEPDISPDAPAELEIFPSTKEVNGYPVVPVRVTTEAMRQVPAFTF